jgi:hypothetical protein
VAARRPEIPAPTMRQLRSWADISRIVVEAMNKGLARMAFPIDE